MEDYKDKIAADLKQRIVEAKKALEEAIKKDDLDAIREKSEVLSKALQEIGSGIYKRAGTRFPRKGSRDRRVPKPTRLGRAQNQAQDQRDYCNADFKS